MTATTTSAEIATDQVSDILKTISIPPCPTIVSSLMTEARRDDVDFGKIVRLISGDLSLAASMMKTANSPYFGLRQKVQSVQQAVVVLGLKNVLNIVTGVALKQTLTPNQINMERFWDRSNYHAVVSSRLARRIPGVSVEDAYTFGLFHDCGIPILMQRFPNYKETLAAANQGARPMREVENERHKTDHSAVGAMLARNWQLPPLLVSAIRFHHDMGVLTDAPADVPSEARGLTAISLVADYLIARFLGAAEEAEWRTHGAEALDYLGFDEDEMTDLTRDINDELSTIRADRH